MTTLSPPSAAFTAAIQALGRSGSLVGPRAPNAGDLARVAAFIQAALRQAGKKSGG